MKKLFPVLCFATFLLITSCILVGCGPEPTYEELKLEHQEFKDIVGGLIVFAVLVVGFIWFVNSRKGKE